MANVSQPMVTVGRRTEIELGSPNYPETLLHMENPPAVLHVIGNEEALGPGLAVVGARKATPYGLSLAQRFANIAAQLGLSIISGGAIGCDQEAHRGALKAGGRTVVVLGSGADVVYPRRAKDLFEQVVANGGALVSELPWGAPPQRWAFRKRNRIIAGLAKAVLIVEAGLPSGTFSTADYALEAGKEVLAVPGSILSRESYGSNMLICEGATPVIDDDSFLRVLGRLFETDRAPAEVPNQLFDALPFAANQTQRKLLSMLAATPQTPDQILDNSRLTMLEVLRELSALETMGVVTKYPDGRFGVRFAGVDKTMG